MTVTVDEQVRSDADLRLDYLDATSALLWPDSRRVARRGRPGRDGELLVAPAARRPRVLLPAGNPRAAAAAVLAQGAGSGRSARLQRRALAAIARAGLAPWLMPQRIVPGAGDSITTHLAGVLGRPLWVSTALTPQRANRKPVLHLMDDAGRSLAWAKIGVNPLTSALVRREADVLRTLDGARLGRLRSPHVRHHGSWRELDVLVLEALPAAGAGRPASAALTEAMQALSGTPIDRSAGTPYPAVLAARADALRDRVGEADRPNLARIRTLLADLPPAGLRSGSWHGDWTPWNCAAHGGDVLVWDWERAAGGVPAGFDALHHRLQDALVSRGVPHTDAARDCIAGAPATLAGWSVPADAARLTAALYLVEIALRYIADDQRSAAGFGGCVETWILPALLEYKRTVARYDEGIVP